MRFEIAHELDAPLDSVELAVLSPELGNVLARELARVVTRGPRVGSVETTKHVLERGELQRVLRFQATAPLPIFGDRVPADAMSWEETTTYRLADHASTWTVAPKEAYRRWFRSEGTYRLERLAEGRTRRTVVGELEVRLALIGKLVERMAIAEVKKTYDAEAESLRALLAA